MHHSTSHGPGAMRAAAVTSLTRAAVVTGMGRLDTNYPSNIRAI